MTPSWMTLLAVFAALWAGPARASAGPPELPHAQEGDVILLPMRCTLCSIIAQETASEYSHSGVLIRSPRGEWAVAQALGRVHKVPVQLFLSRTAPGKRPGIFRHRELERRPQLGKRLWREFQAGLDGLAFDHLFLWENRDQHGRELLYCSEFVAKFLGRVLPSPILPAPMDFSQHPEFWEKYFSSHGGMVPQDLLGMAPADIERSGDFVPVPGP